MKAQTLAIAAAILSLSAIALPSAASAQVLTHAVPTPPPPTKAQTKPTPEPVVELPVEVCLYTQKIYNGNSKCTTAEGIFELSPSWRTRVRSIRIENAVVKLCPTEDYNAGCMILDDDKDQLPSNVSDYILRVVVR